MFAPAASAVPPNNTVFGRDGSYKQNNCLTTRAPLGGGSTSFIPPVGGFAEWQCMTRSITPLPQTGNELGIGELRFSAQLSPRYNTLPKKAKTVRGEFCNMSRYPDVWTYNSYAVITPSGRVTGWCRASVEDTFPRTSSYTQNDVQPLNAGTAGGYGPTAQVAYAGLVVGPPTAPIAYTLHATVTLNALAGLTSGTARVRCWWDADPAKGAEADVAPGASTALAVDVQVAGVQGAVVICQASAAMHDAVPVVTAGPAAITVTHA